MFFTVLIFFIIIPWDAQAWGPLAHLDYAHEALRNLAVLAPAVKEILSRCPNDFLYGALAADITLGKSYVDYVYNCHNWKVGFEILKAAKNPSQKATAYGYLAHLAADIISHNFFVPYYTIKSFRTRTLGHVYWEMRFDAKRPKKIWRLVKEIGVERFDESDQLLQTMVRRTLFSFRINKRIFSSILTLHRIRHWKQVMHRISHRSPHLLTNADVHEFRSLAVQSVITFLTRLEKAPCTRVDPTGKQRLVYASRVRKELRNLYRKGTLSDTDANHFLAIVKRQLREGIYNQQAPLPEWTISL